MSLALLALVACVPKQPIDQFTAAPSDGAPPSDTIVVARVDEAFRTWCEDRPCREGLKFSLKKEDGSSIHYSFALAPPVVQEGPMLIVMPGETVYVEATIDGDTLTGLTAVPSNTHPARTLVLELRQVPELNEGTEMMLEIHNPFPRHLRYRLGMSLLESDEVYATTTCPVPPGLVVYEHWPHPIFQLMASELRLVSPETDDLACR